MDFEKYLESFYSLQCDTNALKGSTCTLKQLLPIVLKAFKDYDVSKLERIDAIQYEIYRQIIDHDGGNDFPMPHSGIRKRQNQDEVVADLRVSNEQYEHLEATISELRQLVDHNDMLN